MSDLWDQVEESFDDEDCALSGIEAFDDSPAGAKKLALLAVVSKGLCDDKVPTPELTLSEATAAAVYCRWMSPPPLALAGLGLDGDGHEREPQEPFPGRTCR